MWPLWKLKGEINHSQKIKFRVCVRKRKNIRQRERRERRKELEEVVFVKVEIP
jgi:hypothetical protein